jgi:hypothetical protein
MGLCSDSVWQPIQVTTIQADAADDAAISGVCKQALRDEGKLDVFFANVRHLLLASCSLIHWLINIHSLGRYPIQRYVGKRNCRNIHEGHACQCLVVRGGRLFWWTWYFMFWNNASVFLAIQHASTAMKVTNPSRGKEFSGGSIIVTASGRCFICGHRPDSAHCGFFSGWFALWCGACRLWVFVRSTCLDYVP